MVKRRKNGQASNGNRNNHAELAAAGGDNDDISLIEHIEETEESETEELEEDEIQPEAGQGDATSTHSTCTPVRKCIRILGWSLVNFTLFFAVFLVVIAPLIVKIFPEIPKHIVYLNSFKIPYDTNLSDPSSVELNYTRNFYHQTEEGITIGVWHILPKSLEQEGLEDEKYKKLLSSGRPIILYCHGNTGNRATSHRIDMYKVLSAEDFHVLALDYRGYGDSTGSPTSENGVMSDVVTLYLWLKKVAGPDVPIYVWGHSLGTGIATKAVRFLTEQQDQHPHGLILESPFNNIFDAALEHPFSVVFRLLWWFDDVFLETMHKFGIYLQSDEHICHIDIPVMILHAEDDFVVPFKLGEKLYEASKARPSTYPPVIFHRFDYSRGFKHKWICTAEELPDLVHKFTEDCKKYVKKLRV